MALISILFDGMGGSGVGCWCVENTAVTSFSRKVKFFLFFSKKISVSGFRSLNLLQNVTSTVNEVCRRLKSEEKPTVKGSRLIPCSSHAVKNGRRKMEDRHVIVHDINAIYSGHANQVS